MLSLTSSFPLSLDNLALILCNGYDVQVVPQRIVEIVAKGTLTQEKALRSFDIALNPVFLVCFGHKVQ